MKKTALFASLLCLAQSTLHADVPLFINYQGKVADSTGLPIGATGTAAAPVAAPTNRKVIFRIYDASTGGTRLWTEEQTATISLGVFSVLLGNGINPTGTANAESRPALDTIFTPSAASSRFLEIMVDNGDNAITGSDVPISPRQQITSTAFALHAKVADGIAPASSTSTDLNISPATLPVGSLASYYGLGWYGTGRLFNSVAVDGPVLYGNNGGALGSNFGGTQQLALAWSAAGQVGIGATSSYDTNNKLTLQGDDSVTPARQLVIRGNTDTTKRLNIGYDTTANKASLQSYTAASTAGPLLLNPSGGNVGVNNTAPSVALDVTGAIKASTTIQALGNVYGSVLQASNYIEAFGRISANGSSGFNFFNGGDTDGGLYSPADGTVTIKTNATERVRVDSNGNVGINNTSPLGRFTVNSGASAITIGDTNPTTGAWIRNDGLNTVFSTNVGDMYFGTYGSVKSLYFYNGPSFAMTVAASGKVGIGTSTPVAGLQVEALSSSITGQSWSYASKGNINGGSFSTIAGGSPGVTIYTSGNIGCGAAYFFSDVRIKDIIGHSDGGRDLETLLGIEVTDYTFKDKIGLGAVPQKKVIAQQVEKVFPQAVTRAPGVVPDIYQLTPIKDGWVQLNASLKVGERVKLMTQDASGIYEVLETRPDGFRTAFKPNAEQVFVFGREVKDFLSVDYDEISMLNVSATQQLKREKDAELQILRDENSALRRELAAKDASLEAKDASLEKRLIALERRMSAEGATETVSLKTAQAVK